MSDFTYHACFHSSVQTTDTTPGSLLPGGITIKQEKLEGGPSAAASTSSSSSRFGGGGGSSEIGPSESKVSKNNSNIIRPFTSHKYYYCYCCGNDNCHCYFIYERFHATIVDRSGCKFLCLNWLKIVPKIQKRKRQRFGDCELFLGCGFNCYKKYFTTKVKVLLMLSLYAVLRIFFCCIL